MGQVKFSKQPCPTAQGIGVELKPSLRLRPLLGRRSGWILSKHCKVTTRPAFRVGLWNGLSGFGGRSRRRSTLQQKLNLCIAECLRSVVQCGSHRFVQLLDSITRRSDRCGRDSNPREEYWPRRPRSFLYLSTSATFTLLRVGSRLADGPVPLPQAETFLRGGRPASSSSAKIRREWSLSDRLRGKAKTAMGGVRLS
jgi:hypothetical protein